MMRSFIFVIFISIFLPSCFLDNDLDGGNQQEIPTEAYQVYHTSITGLSGLCFSRNANTFLAVSDKIGIFELSKEGVIVRKFPYSGSNDFEGITINPVTEDIYLADEGQMRVYQLSKDEKSLVTVTDVFIPNAVFNKGIEGLSFGNDTLYIVNQESPTLLMKYDLKTMKEVSRVKVEFAAYLSDIFYDDFDKTLWICDSEKKKIIHCDINGQVLGIQNIDYISKAEAIVVDRVAGLAWVGCDATGNLYRIKLTI
ncbi:MAG: SdiA-regulated domain-containing protein [Saprospiraceae bacterium]|nr:SdiA-regulated domain-containing protein [Saprospiraceae bacterium]